MPRTRIVTITTVPQSFSFLAEHPRFLASRGFDIHAVSSPGPEWASFVQNEPVSVHQISMPRRISPISDIVALWKLYWLLRTLQPHIVHGHTPKGGLLGMIAAWLANVPVRVYTIHGLPLMTAVGWKRSLLQWTERISCLCASQVLSVSRSICTVAICLQLCPARKIDILLGGSANGIDTLNRFNPARWNAANRLAIRRKHAIPEDALVVGFVGRIVRDKGLVELADAWHILREKFPALHLLILGPFEPQDPIPEEVEELFRTDPRIHLTGLVAETASYYPAMDILVLPTYREGLPGVLLEAAAMELPVVATRIPGCVDAVIDGRTATLVPPRDYEALATAIAAYLENPALRRQHGLAGRQWVSNEFRREAILQSLYDLYIRLLQRCNIPIRAEMPPTGVAPLHNNHNRRAA
jgi:glycosyltransferase involved in cell wall biosynthesis